jgi:hypothetical protein
VVFEISDMKIFTFILLAVITLFAGWFLIVRGLLTLLNQHDAESFPHVQGQVLSSQVTITHGSKGRVYYHPSIHYMYNVDGRVYSAWRYRYDGRPTDSESANAIVEEHPAGSSLEVYYRPQNPADALLSPGVESGDVGLFFFVATLVAFLLWATTNSGREIDWPWTSPLVAGGMMVTTEMMVVRVRLPRFQPLSVALLTTTVLCVLAAMLSLFAFATASPWTVWRWSIAVVFLSGGIVYLWQFINVYFGKQDLVIDEGARTIQLPLTYGRREQISMSFLKVRSVVLNKVQHQRKNGVYYTYLVTLEMMDNTEQKLIDLNQARAESLAAWLKAKFGFIGETQVLDA